MAEIGRRNRLTVNKIKDFGLYLDAEQFGEVLLPKRDMPADIAVGDALDVTLYLDSEDRLIATTTEPKAEQGQVALLNVLATNAVGAFLDWGLPKDLLLPFAEQKKPVKAGDRVLVKIYLDNSDRLAASSKLDRHLDKQKPYYEPNQAVDIVVADRTDLGTKVIINDRHWGMLFKADQFRPLRYGERTRAYIKQVRSDGKIDLFQNPPGKAPLGALHEQIITHLREHQGFSPLADQSSAEEIASQYGVSKRKYKMAIGKLKSDGLVRIESDGIHLIEK